MSDALRELIARITDCLANGGLFNMEMMELGKVTGLLVDCRRELEAALAVEPRQEWTFDGRAVAHEIAEEFCGSSEAVEEAIFARLHATRKMEQFDAWTWLETAFPNASQNALWDTDHIEIAERAYAAGQAAPTTAQLASWMIAHSFATGHGDTFEDLLKELEWQIAELKAMGHARSSQM